MNAQRKAFFAALFCVAVVVPSCLGTPLTQSIGDGEYLDDHDLLPEVRADPGQELERAIHIGNLSWDEPHDQQQTHLAATNDGAISASSAFKSERTFNAPSFVAGNSRSYPFECSTSRTFTSVRISTDEVLGLHQDVCSSNPELSGHSLLSDNPRALDFCVNSANVRHHPAEQAAQFGVSVTVLQPFSDCNVRTAVCVMINHLQSQGILLRDEVHFWDLSQQLQRLLEDTNFGSFDANGRFKVASGSAERAAVVSLSRYLQRNTSPKQ